ncbi:ribosome maturation factor RimP [Solicola gregarius]|uniref:Ribosome maturation factor RimP n=1 Tax=Solicola gregarius TaxID=2908642 RepID=A0AA46TFP6_9ACTN|nr:ribosome maturation factor RimP [Solicola gregarius]UYM04479.1 ribosome maturation factor RimP [Solicola gregarius]
MSKAPVPEALEQALATRTSELGLDLEAVELTPAGRRRVLRVAVDQDGGVTLDDIADATKEISTMLDASDLMGEQPYTLEVTSRGTDRPLTLPRHWRRNVDRLVRVTPDEGEAFEGRIVDADEATDGGARVKTATGVHALAYDAVKKARVVVELNRKEG